MSPKVGGAAVSVWRGVPLARISIDLTDATLDRLTQYAKSRGYSRNWVVEESVKLFLLARERHGGESVSVDGVRKLAAKIAQG